MLSVRRPKYIEQIEQAFRVNPICALLGPRQCGKTTLAQHYQETIQGPIAFFDLEDPNELRALENPKLTLQYLKGLIIIDEVQRRPELFPYLRVLVDRNPDIRLLILGSASRELIQQSSETLAGRIGYVDVHPFDQEEATDSQAHWFRGGYPRSYLATNDQESFAWRKGYIRTFLEMDIPNLGFQIHPAQLRRFWYMLSDYHGNIFNASALGRAIQLSDKTVKSYLDILSGTFMMRTLQPWYANISKRQVKSPKVYFRDSGLFHSVAGIETYKELLVSSKVGASWEGYALEEIIRHHTADPHSCFFWASQSGAEIDLLITESGRKLAYEFKYTNSPTMTKSMWMAKEFLELDKVTIVIPGEPRYWINEFAEVRGIETFGREE